LGKRKGERKSICQTNQLRIKRKKKNGRNQTLREAVRKARLKEATNDKMAADAHRAAAERQKAEVSPAVDNRADRAIRFLCFKFRFCFANPKPETGFNLIHRAVMAANHRLLFENVDIYGERSPFAFYRLN
jgi:hypothetical protein